ncbi:MAG: hypothetical protein NC184_04310 [Roseburia sp.]|nr:hypothetical protein [Roseburia sp.]
MNKKIKVHKAKKSDNLAARSNLLFVISTGASVSERSGEIQARKRRMIE